MTTLGPKDLGATALLGRASGFDVRRSQLDELLKKQLFFVGGYFKSGTTWIQLLLDNHPEASCSGECHLITHLYRTLKAAMEDHNRFLLKKHAEVFGEISVRPPNFDEADLECLVTTGALLLLDKHRGGKPALAVGEKTPDNVAFFEVLGRLLPAAKFIHVIRDPRDAAVSGWYHVTRVIPDDTRRHFPTMFDYLKHFVDGWANFVPMALEFGARHPKRYAQVLYGKLSAEPEAELSRVLRFLGVSTDIDTVRRCVAATAFDRLSGGRARGQENRTSLFRKGISGDWRNHFDEATDRYAIEKAGPLMRRFGFI